MEYDVDAAVFEAQQRMNWYIDGKNIHCLTPKLFLGMSTERICELYNVDMEFFRPNTVKLKRVS